MTTHPYIQGPLSLFRETGNLIYAWRVYEITLILEEPDSKQEASSRAAELLQLTDIDEFTKERTNE